MPKGDFNKAALQVCYLKEKKKQYRVYSRCSASQCNVNLHFTKERNCFREWHSVEFHRKY